MAQIRGGLQSEHVLRVHVEQSLRRLVKEAAGKTVETEDTNQAILVFQSKNWREVIWKLEELFTYMKADFGRR